MNDSFARQLNLHPTRFLSCFYYFTWICHLDFSMLYFIEFHCDRFVHKIDNAFSIQSTWPCCWLDQFLTLANSTWILSKFFNIFQDWPYFVRFNGCGASFVPSCYSVQEFYYLFSGVKLSMRSAVVIWRCFSSFIENVAI